MSGGPVFNDKDQVCGVICNGIGSGETEYSSTASLLWLAMITALDIPVDRFTAGDQYFAFDLFTNDFIRQSGWETVISEKRAQFEIMNDDDDNHVIAWKDDAKPSVKTEPRR
jgi:hypothetical protein